ncbi:MAG: zinc ABC transporter substrate-binding protein [Calditrichia bacterium]
MFRKTVFVFTIYALFFSCRVQAEKSTLIVTSIKPFALIVERLVGQEATVKALVPPGMSPHTYEPSPSEMKMLSRARLVIYGADDLDGWVKKLPAGYHICLFKLLPDSLKLSGNTEEPHHEGHHHHGEYDPHFWTDPLAVNALLKPLAERLQKLLPELAPFISQNARQFAGELEKLDREIRRQLEPVRERNLAVSHSFFNYFLNRYHFTVTATIEPVAGVETSPRQLVRMIRQLKEWQVAAILIHPQLPERAARVVFESSGIPLISLDPLGAEKGVKTYPQFIRQNVKKLMDGMR